MASSGINAAVKTQKLALRKAITVSLRQLGSADVEQQCEMNSLSMNSILISYVAEAITTQLLALPAFKTCRTVSCYLSMPTAEAGTSTIVNAIFQSGPQSFLIFFF